MGRRRGGAAVAAVDDMEEAVDGAGASPAESAREELPIPSPRYVAPGELQTVPLAQLVDSPTQPRQFYDEAYIDQLAASIAANGLQQPPTVRVSGDADGWEIVVGHCRVRAARRAGLEEICVIVRDMSNSEVAIAQLVENLQRRDLSALDEAEALRRLVDAPGNTVPAVARDLGLSVSQVYTRLKLLDLVPPARNKLAEGKLSPSIAVLLARVPTALQERALEELLPPWNDEREVSTRAAKDILSSRYLKRLDRARWSLEDAALVPAAGACNACPYRNFAEADDTGGREPRGAAAGAALCLEPRCYDAKQAAYNARVLEAARDAGRTVVEGDKAERLLVETQKGGGTHVDASQVQFWDQRKVRTWSDIADAAGAAGDAVPEVILVVGSDGELHEVFAKRAALKMAERVKARLDAGRAAKAASDNAAARADFEAAVEKHQAEQEAFQATLAELYERSSTRKPSVAEWRVLVDLLELQLVELGAGQGVAQPAEFAQPGEAFSVCLRLGVMNLGDHEGLDGWLQRACAVYRIPTPAERGAGVAAAGGADAGKPKAKPKPTSRPAGKGATKKAEAKRAGKPKAVSKRRKS